MNFVVKAITMLTLGVLSSYSAASNIELSFGLGLTDEPAAGSGQYLMSDGSYRTLHAGNGFGFMLNQTISSIESVDIIAGAGLQWGTIKGDLQNTTITDRFSYLPTEVSAQYALTSELSIKAGASYLFLPVYARTYGSGDNWAKVKGSSSIGYSVSAQYNLNGGYFFAKYASNDVRYEETSNSNGSTFALNGSLRDEQVDVVHFGLGMNF